MSKETSPSSLDTEKMPFEKKVRFGVWEAMGLDVLCQQRHHESSESSVDDMVSIVAQMQGLPIDAVAVRRQIILDEMPFAGEFFDQVAANMRKDQGF